MSEQLVDDAPVAAFGKVRCGGVLRPGGGDHVHDRAAVAVPGPPEHGPAHAARVRHHAFDVDVALLVADAKLTLEAWWALW